MSTPAPVVCTDCLGSGVIDHVGTDPHTCTECQGGGVRGREYMADDDEHAIFLGAGGAL